MKYYATVFLLCISLTTSAQELFVMTEPASNVPAGSVGVRVGQSFLKNQFESGWMYNLSPEITWGINKNLMVRSSAFFSNENNELALNGGGVYAKYRFLSVDDMQSHFRMAAFGQYSYSNAAIYQEAIDLTAGNSGFEAGLVATQLIHKVAISSSLSFVRALNNNDYQFPEDLGNSAVNYTLSVGKLMHPKKYTSFKQTNINAMLEFVGQTITENGNSYLDIVPSIQFIINSQARVDLAYQKELYSSIYRTATDGVILKLEYTFFNVTK